MVVPVKDTSTVKAIVAWGHYNEFRVFLHDFNTGERDTLYVGVEYYKDSIWLPKWEYFELRIESTDSVYLRHGCTRVRTVIAGNIIYFN